MILTNKKKEHPFGLFLQVDISSDNIGQEQEDVAASKSPKEQKRMTHVPKAIYAKVIWYFSGHDKKTARPHVRIWDSVSLNTLKVNEARKE